MFHYLIRSRTGQGLALARGQKQLEVQKDKQPEPSQRNYWGRAGVNDHGASDLVVNLMGFRMTMETSLLGSI